MKLNKAAAFLSLVLLSVPVHTLQAYNLRQISKNNGLSNSAILSIAQDGDGFMWLGTADGVNICDGTNVDKNGLFGPGNSLSGNVIEGMHISSGGSVWIMTNYGMDRYDPDTQAMLHFYDYGRDYKPKECAFTEAFFITERLDFVYYKDGGLVSRPIGYSHPYDNILYYFADDAGNLFIFGRDGLCTVFTMKSVSGGTIELAAESEFRYHDTEVVFCSDQDDGVVCYVDSRNVLYEYHLNAPSGKHYIADISSAARNRNEISSIVRHHNDYFIGYYTDDLIALKHTPERAAQYQIETIGINAGVFSLFRDKQQDTVWIGTDGQGVYIYYDDTFSLRSFPLESFTRDIRKPVRSFVRDRSGALWFATKGDGIVRLPDFDPESGISPEKVSYFNTSNSGLSNNSVFKLAESNRDVLWIGNDDGIDFYSFRTGQIRKLRERDGSDDLKYIHGIYQTDDNTMWVASVGLGIYKVMLEWNDGAPVIAAKERFHIMSGGMSSNYFFAMYPEDNTTLWFGNRGYGAFRIDTEKAPPHNKSLNAADSRIRSFRFSLESGTRMHDDIYSIARSPDGYMWFGTSAGLVKYSERDGAAFYDAGSGLPSNFIHGIQNDRLGNLWLATNEGLVKFTPSNDNMLVFNQRNGLDVVEFSDGAYYTDPATGALLFGGINGFVSISESSYRRKEFMPRIAPKSLSIFGEEQRLGNYIHDSDGVPVLALDYSENFFALTFSAVDYISGSNYTYSYSFGELGDNWIDNGTSSTFLFTNMAPGSYRMRVKYLNQELGTESPVYEMSIRIIPPWYASDAAKVVYFLALIAAVLLTLYYLSKRSERRHNAEMEKLESEHEKELYESKLRFFTNIAHEFCTPLTLIYGPCERILGYEKSDYQIRQYAGVIQRNTNRLNYLIQDLIDFRKIETGNKVPVLKKTNISGMVTEIAENFTVLSDSKSINYTLDIVSGIYWNTDPEFLTTITTNLISNAFKYTDRNGSISISAGIEGEQLVLRVSNTGKGLRDEDIDKIFNRYTIIKDLEDSGSDSNNIRNGLGLAISYNMATLLGGKIKVKSIRYERTDFIVSLPPQEASQAEEIEQQMLAPPAPSELPIAEEMMPPRRVFNKNLPTILVIDDETDMLWFMSDIFADEYNVITTNKPAKLESILEDTIPNVIISDVMMPGRSGIEITRIIKSNPKTSHIGLILVSADHQLEQQLEGLKAGAEMYITKPFNVEYLKTFVRHLISRKETLKDYFSSPLSAFELTEGELMHTDQRKFIQQIVEIINNNLTVKGLSAKFIAEKLNISVRQLYRKLQDIGDYSPLDMIHQCRLHVAEDLLKNSTLTIDEIIHKSGFSNRGPFFKAFAAKFGCTPKEFREKHHREI